MDLNHAAVFIDNIDQSALAPALGGWGGDAITITKQPCTVDGRPGEHSGRTRRLRMASKPIFGLSVEDVAPGAPIQPLPGNPWHHLAVWCDDIAGTAEVLERHGYRKEVVGRGPNGELATFAYMVSDRGPRIELADAAMKQGLLAYFASTAAAEGEKPGGELAAPLSPCEIAVVVDGTERLEALRECWRDAFGAHWGQVGDNVAAVWTPDGERELRTRSVSTSTDPRVTIIAPEPDSLAQLSPVDVRGWHHVTFRSADLANDVAWLRRSGFTMEFCDPGDGGQPKDFALLASPEGTRVKLVRA